MFPTPTSARKSSTPKSPSSWISGLSGAGLDELSSELAGKVKIVKLNVDDNPGTASKYGVRSIPTMILFKGGEAADMKIGAGTPKAGLTKWLESHAA
jgi:thioredoxin 1